MSLCLLFVLQTCEPMFVMLSQWMFDGELEDRHSELFIAADPSVTDDRLWHDKYQLRSEHDTNTVGDGAPGCIRVTVLRQYHALFGYNYTTNILAIQSHFLGALFYEYETMSLNYAHFTK